MLLINIVLMIVGIIIIGFDFGSKTIYSSFVLSGMVWLFQKLIPLALNHCPVQGRTNAFTRT